MPIIMLFLSFSCLLVSDTYAGFAQDRGNDAFAASVKQTLNDLGRIRVEPFDPEIPVTVRPLLTRLKREILDLIHSTMNDERVRWNTPDDLRSKVTLALKSAGVELDKEGKHQSWKEEQSPQSYFYDDIERITIESQSNHPDLLVVTTTIWVMCGEDTSFYVFRRDGTVWNLILADEADNYPNIKDARYEFGYAISPSDKNGSFFIVVADINPWCTSFWQSIRYAVLRLGADPYEPEFLLKKSDVVYEGVDTPFTIAAAVNRFRIEFWGDWYFDSESHEQFAEYRVDRHRVSLIRRGKVK